jgi:ABC-2 type transport system permease protein
MTSWLRLFRAELRKLTTTKMPWAFLGVLVVLAVLNGVAVVAGTDMDGSKKFISTAADQKSLMAFANNAMMGAALFGAIAAAREYAHATVVPTYLIEPRRHRALLAQVVAVMLAGAVLSTIGAGLIIAAIAVTLPTTDYGFLVSAGGVGQVLGASAFAGAAGAALGVGIGTLVRNVGGAVTATFLLLMVLPPLIIQLANDAASWVPAALTNVTSGVASDVATPAAFAALAVWGAVPVLLGLVVLRRRDVV